VHGILRDALAMARGEIDQKQITVTLKLDGDQAVVRGDDVRLKQVFWNVIKNAAKFTPAAGQIIIETTRLEDRETLAIKVTDTGIGMTPVELNRIFEAFSQGDHASQGSSHRFGGMGLGLAISRMMVKLHAGSISATSPGRNEGTTFLIKLPLHQTPQNVHPAGNGSPTANGSPQAALPHAKAEADQRLRRILLVEDHQPTAQALTQLLTRRKYEVVAASCLAEARACINRDNFDLLISDIGLPDGNGCELMMELRGRNNLIGIALTGYGMEEDVKHSQEAGFVTQLTKPVSVQALDGVLSAVSDRLNK
jgi:CheY-like chemotaxis protein